MVLFLIREDEKNLSAFVATYKIVDVNIDEFWKEILILFISL